MTRFLIVGDGPHFVPVVADYHGTGRAQPAMYDLTNRRYWIVLPASGAPVLTTIGLPGSIPVPADYDGDNRADVAIYRPLNGLFFIIRSGGGVTSAILGDGEDVPLTKRPSLPGATRSARRQSLIERRRPSPRPLPQLDVDDPSLRSNEVPSAASICGPT